MFSHLNNRNFKKSSSSELNALSSPGKSFLFPPPHRDSGRLPARWEARSDPVCWGVEQ